VKDSFSYARSQTTGCKCPEHNLPWRGFYVPGTPGIYPCHISAG